MLRNGLHKWLTLTVLLTLLHACLSHTKSVASGSHLESTRACRRACSILLKKFPNQTFIDASPDMEDAKQRERIPACYVQPNNAEEAALIYTTVKEERCAFAIKSGGHARLPNQSNAENGITIDLERINHVDVADDHTWANLGCGSRWSRAYTELEKHNLTVMGGRVGGVGVGGFYMGGGIAYFSGRHGWACDHIEAFEVVLPNSTIAQITEDSDPSLFWALHGGSNNFGIVTSFKVRAWNPDPMYWRVTPALGLRFPGLARLNEQFARESTDPDAAILIAVGRLWGLWITSTQTIHTNHQTGDQTVPNVFKPWMKSPWILPFTSQYRAPTSMAYVANGMAESAPPGFRTIFRTMTIEVSAQLEQEMSDIFWQFINEMKPLTKGSKATFYDQPTDAFVFEPFIIFQSLPRKTLIQTLSSANEFSTSPFDHTRTFPFHLSPDSPPLDIVLLSLRYSHPPPKYHVLFPTQESWDEFMDTATRNLWDRLEHAARTVGKFHPFIYPNYAGSGQNPYTNAALGKETVDRLKEVQRRVDPEGIYAEGGLCTGGFKIVRDEDDEQDGNDDGFVDAVPEAGVKGSIKKITQASHGKDEL